jgi:hypothetical protein
MAKKKKGTKGTGHKGSTHVASQAELNIHQRALSGKQDISTETLYDKALVAEQIKIGEDKTSSSQRIKKGDVTGLNEKTNKRTTSKKDREKERDRKKAVKAYHKRNKSSRAVRRSVRNN